MAGRRLHIEALLDDPRAFGVARTLLVRRSCGRRGDDWWRGAGYSARNHEEVQQVALLTQMWVQPKGTID